MSIKLSQSELQTLSSLWDLYRQETNGNPTYAGRQSKPFQRFLIDKGYTHFLENEPKKVIQKTKPKKDYRKIVDDLLIVVSEFKLELPFGRAFCIQGFTKLFQQWLQSKAPRTKIEELEAEFKRIITME
ncbi:MAG: hypothetical protein U9Q73_01840 [Nanoarchaeota archaeon]|nr:hypothetical protein [Nanoarchaeota archaeon]